LFMLSWRRFCLLFSMSAQAFGASFFWVLRGGGFGLGWGGVGLGVFWVLSLLCYLSVPTFVNFRVVSPKFEGEVSLLLLGVICELCHCGAVCVSDFPLLFPFSVLYTCSLLSVGACLNLHAFSYRSFFRRLECCRRRRWFVRVALWSSAPHGSR